MADRQTADRRVQSTGKHLAGILTLSTPASRLICWVFLTFLIYVVPYKVLENLSIYKLLGWETAPSIGLTRAYWNLLHGNGEAAMEMNKLIILVLVIGIPLLVIDSYKLLRQTRYFRR